MVYANPQAFNQPHHQKDKHILRKEYISEVMSYGNVSVCDERQALDLLMRQTIQRHLASFSL